MGSPAPRAAEPARVYLAGDKAVVEVDPAALAVTRTWTLDFDPSSLVFDAQRNRAFATPHLGLKVAELGRDDGKVHMSVTTGRSGTKVGKAIGLALVGVTERSGTAFAMGEDGFRHADGLLFFGVFWHQNPQQGIHLIKGEYKGEGPWKVGKNVIHVLGCHGSDPDLANLYAEWQYYLQTCTGEYPSADEIRSLAKARGALI